MDPFAALADPVRRELLRALAAGPARVVDLAAAHPISRPAVSKHLRLLTEAGLTTVEDRGRERHYALDRAGLAPVVGLLGELRRPAPAAPFAEAALAGLDLEVRRTVRDQHATPSSQLSQPSQPSQEETG
ncbi:helix-turn-helix transcriptional regulator [Nocardioides sp.]|uniref:ArsR/SmtB family transcription factor n=1 Tax=Nocardioides sp. TaxID=35761 RepID=UPI00272833E2|nr:metalloregulator ArsR/SmtB family transcription factor [Nocardioides sp.]MDO9455946.1 metalloregulator ArsR/SmtB family transcription factor [Nocardioides sp.]